MKNLQSLFLLLFVASATVFTGCNEGEGGDPEPNKDGIITSQEDDDLDPESLQGEVKADIVLDANTTWILTGPLSVKDGFTLTIDPGTTIKAAAGGTNVYIAIEQGAKIDAEGTASAPITITSNAANPRAGDWGGLIVCGKATISGEDASATSTTEVLPLTYGGGTDDEDDSGVIKYVELWYTGARINGEKEFNGFTFYGVGSTTVVENIAVFYGDDDAIEFFGGTVEVVNALMVNARDDMFDWTQGWTGKGTNFYGLRTEGYTSISEDTRGVEADGNLDGNSPSHINQSNPTITGLTIINEEPLVDFADLIKIRRGSGATITGLYVSDVSDASDFIDFSDSKGMADNATSVTGKGVGTVDVEDVKTQSDFDDPADGIQADEMTDATFTFDDAATSVDFGLFSWTSWE